MTIVYGYKWFRPKKRLTEVWDEMRAKKCHEQRRLYAALISVDTAPSHFVELNAKYIGVGFLDAELREYMSYAFCEEELGQLFLKEARFREFEEGSDEVIKGTVYMFRRDGVVTIVNEEYATNTRTVKETRMDVSANWEPYPTFGDYVSLIRKDR